MMSITAVADECNSQGTSYKNWSPGLEALLGKVCINIRGDHVEKVQSTNAQSQPFPIGVENSSVTPHTCLTVSQIDALIT